MLGVAKSWKNPDAVLVLVLLITGTAQAGDGESGALALANARAEGASRSTYKQQETLAVRHAIPQANLAEFRDKIEPALRAACVDCHGPDLQEGNLRVDTLDPDLLTGEDISWWLEVSNVVANGEMPPAGAAELADENRAAIIQWLSSEIQVASRVRRSEKSHTSFRRLTRYEYNYALQDLLGLPYDFASDLPPETASVDGFQNSSEVLQMSAMQFAYYRDLSRAALRKAIVRGEQPQSLHWGITMQAAAQKVQAKEKDPKVNSRAAHYKDLMTGEAVRANWNYHGAKYAWEAMENLPEIPIVSSHVAVLPAGQRLIVELGNRVPDAGAMRVRVRAARASVAGEGIPSLRLAFGHQASNNSSAEQRVGNEDIAITAPPNAPEFYQWDIPLSEVVRNPMRRIAKMGDTPNPSEYIKLLNTSASAADLQIDYVQVSAPVYEQWPPQSHRQVFVSRAAGVDEPGYAREVLESFMRRAWRRTVTEAELNQKWLLFERVRPQCDDFQEAMVEVLATVLSSPKFLYLGRVEVSQSAEDATPSNLSDFELATRLAIFLWCSLPDEELLELASQQRLRDPKVLTAQTRRMLADEKSERFVRHFVRGWLGMQLLDFLQVDKKEYPQFDPLLRESMQQEPIAMFQELLRTNATVIDLIHSDYAMLNERLARHYGIPGVYGNHFRKVGLPADSVRGGLLTQAGLLAMNSDGKDSHPLKRGIWLLERLLNDPPPPPPPAVPEIDLADPEIAKLTLKERLEDHRNDPACLSCHAKIDPWGIAFENFDAIGSWRSTINGVPVDAASELFSRQKLDGIEGLKRFLLLNRQDQFVRSCAHKMTTFALGRPLNFDDHAAIEELTVQFRQKEDRLADLILLIVNSEIFQAR